VHAEETGKENDFTGIAPMGLFGGLGGWFSVILLTLRIAKR
jgi:hypothetical protein